ncbi:MAG: poly(3-hydroxybutyrate) depolymerase [Hyphomicrobiaceae bacterium]|nr:poly(3-hydroxybutyrate) depolymerase [Hyphomicrobiaceae bacterium]
MLAGCEEQGSRLPAVGASIHQTSVSGISAGAYMAGQFQLAHGRDVVGAGIIAGGPWGCAESLYADLMPGPGTAFLNLSRAMNGCMLNALQSWGIPDPQRLANRAGQLAAQGRIDPVAAVRADRIYLFTGQEDHTVVPAIVAAAREFYIALGVKEDRIVLVDHLPAGHAFVTEDKGHSCDNTAAPYIVDCNYDMAEAVLRQIYGDLNPKRAETAGQVITFAQSEFLEGLRDHGMADTGAVYVPPECTTAAGCRVHIAFHGCGQNMGAVGQAFIGDAGLLAWAGANLLVVLFPQVKSTPSNPQACWDWWGYTGRAFLTRDAPQIVAVRRMLLRLSSSPSTI